MEEINFFGKKWMQAVRVLRELRYKTDCVKNNELTIKPAYVICLKDVPLSAYHAVKVCFHSKKQFGYEPEIICAGWKNPFIKNFGKDCSENQDAAQICRELGALTVKTLDGRKNEGGWLKVIIDYVGGSSDPVIFCPTMLYSLYLEREESFSPKRIPEAESLNAYFYCPEEYIVDMAQLYNGKGLAGGLPLLSEIAAMHAYLYRNENTAPFEKKLSLKAKRAAEWLESHYPLYISGSFMSAPFQYLRMYFAQKNSKRKISEDLRLFLKEWKEDISSPL